MSAARLRAQIAAHKRWANTTADERTQATAKARAARAEQFERQVDPDGTLDPQERARRVKHAQKAHLLKMQLARHH